MERFDGEDRRWSDEEEVRFEMPISHGRITVEDATRVVSIRGGTLLAEKNFPSPRDGKPRIGFVLKGGSWKFEDKRSDDVRNAITFRCEFNPENMEVFDELEEWVNAIRGFVSEKTAKKFYCTVSGKES